MKKLIHLTAALTLLTLSTLTVRPDDLSQLEGKWSVKKTNNDGQAFTQVIEIKKDKFKFSIVGADNQVRLYAEGDIKLEKLGPFSSVKFANIKAGASAADLQPIDDDRQSIYQLGESGWTVASNFDKDRDNQKPSIDTYVKAGK
jgi:hypothetical protein